MIYLAMGPKKLSRLSYHVIWGLRCDIPGVKTLHDEALHLQAHPEKLDRMKRETEAILLKQGLIGWLVRTFCWLFNWNQYRVNYYSLQGYFSLALYNKGIHMLSASTQHQAIAAEGFLVQGPLNRSFFGINVSNGLPNPVQYASNAYAWAGSHFMWAGSTIRQSIFGNNALPTTRLVEKQTHFSVSEAMLPHLSCLGLEVQVDQTVSIDDVRAAYHKAARRTHPDRDCNSQGKSEQFTQVQTSYTELSTLIQASFSSHDDPFGLLAMLEEDKQKWDEKVEELRTAYKKRDENIAEYSRGVTEFSHGVTELSHGVTELSHGVNALQKSIAETRNDANQLEAEMNQWLLDSQEMDTVNPHIESIASSETQPETTTTLQNRVASNPNTMFAHTNPAHEHDPNTLSAPQDPEVPSNDSGFESHDNKRFDA